MFKSEILKESSHFRKVGEFAVKLPWPFSNRSVYLSVSAMPVKGEKAIIMTMKSIEGDTWFEGTKIKKDPNCTECEIKHCSIVIECLENGKLRLRFTFTADPKMELPQWLIQQGIKLILMIFLKHLQTKAKKLPDRYIKLISEK